MLTHCPIWRLAFLAVVLLAGTCYVLFPTTRSWSLQLPSARTEVASEGTYNATLGFGAIMALTDDLSSWRTQGLRLAATHLGLRVQTPLQANLTDEDALQYLEGHDLEDSLGSVKASINYLSLLHQFLDTGVETALLIEDDVDFGINIKDQLDSLSKAMWQGVEHAHAERTGSGRRALRRQALNGTSVWPDRIADPYRKETWDVLWIGHSGVEFTNGMQTRAYLDPHALPWTRLTSTFNNYYEQVRSKDQSEGSQPQQIFHGATSLATYAWAITRSHAQWLLDDLRSARAQRFDFAMHVHCKGGKQRCTIPVPELMHHHKAIGEVDIGSQGNGSVTRKDLDWWKDVHKYTYNIEWSARCNAAGVGEKLVEGWQCLPSKYDDVV